MRFSLSKCVCELHVRGLGGKAKPSMERKLSERIPSPVSGGASPPPVVLAASPVTQVRWGLAQRCHESRTDELAHPSPSSSHTKLYKSFRKCGKERRPEDSSEGPEDKSKKDCGSEGSIISKSTYL